MSSTNIMEQIQKKYNGVLLTKKEAAEVLKCSCATIDRMRADGIIRSKRIRGRVFISINEISLVLGE